MTAFWQMPYGQDPEDPDAIDVTGLGDPVRSFISLREPSAAELAEFRERWLREAGTLERAIILPGDWGAVVIPGSPVTGADVIPPLEKARRRGQCQGCGTDDQVNVWSRCVYCAELDGLRAGQAAPPWRFIPANLLITDLLIIMAVIIGVGALMYAIFGGL